MLCPIRVLYIEVPWDYVDNLAGLLAE